MIRYNAKISKKFFSNLNAYTLSITIIYHDKEKKSRKKVSANNIFQDICTPMDDPESGRPLDHFIFLDGLADLMPDVMFKNGRFYFGG